MALVAGVVLTAVGLVGFFGTTLLGFGLNTPHNLLHLASGLLGLWAVWKGWSRVYNQWLGGFYLLLGLLGFMAGGFMASLLGADTTDHWWHLFLGAALALTGFVLKSAHGPQPSSS
jgi:hypothetical protein